MSCLFLHYVQQHINPKHAFFFTLNATYKGLCVCVAELSLCVWLSIICVFGWDRFVCVAVLDLCAWLSWVCVHGWVCSACVAEFWLCLPLSAICVRCWVVYHPKWLSPNGKYWNCLATDAETCVLRWKWVTFGCWEWVLGVGSEAVLDVSRNWVLEVRGVT